MLYRPLLILSAGIAALGVGAAASAQAPAAAPGPKPVARTELVREINANYKAVDTNGDGAVTAAEIARGADSRPTGRRRAVRQAPEPRCSPSSTPTRTGN